MQVRILLGVPTMKNIKINKKELAICIVWILIVIMAIALPMYANKKAIEAKKYKESIEKQIPSDK